MNVNQLRMHNLAPRGIASTCVPTSLCFVTGAVYQDVEYLLVREQPKTYRPEVRSNGGVNTLQFLGQKRVMFGHVFIKKNLNNQNIRQFVSSNPRGTFVVCVPRHMLVIQNGQMFDLANTMQTSTVVGVWEVTKV